MIEIYSIHNDDVIDGKYLVCKTTYELAVNVLFNLIDKQDLQRNLLKSKLYQRLGRDLVNGCVMPPLTIAFLADKNQFNNKAAYEEFINQNLESAFVLDGIQRLNTLERVSRQGSESLDLTRPLFINIIICEKKDKLLYRLITLNNGQKPMSARHQIEILTEDFLEGEDIPILIQSEKKSYQSKTQRTYKMADVVKAYVAFLTGLINYDNQKIIEEKMDEIIADKVLEYNVSENNPEFVSVLGIVHRFTESEAIYTWLQNNNNFIGFSVGIRKSFKEIEQASVEDFENSVKAFNSAFDKTIDVSKIKLGKERRKLALHFIENYHKTKTYDENDFGADFMDLL